jgi:hypothetical protein
VLDTKYAQTKTNNVNKTWALLQTTGGQDEPNIAFNAEIVTDITTWNSVISRRSVFLMEETGVPEENHRPAASHWQILSHNVVSRTPRLSGVRTHHVSGDRHWLHWYLGSSKPNYHTTTTKTAPLIYMEKCIYWRLDYSILECQRFRSSLSSSSLILD